MKLISSKDFGKSLVNDTNSEYRRKRDLYDKFLEQPLKLEMFIPFDGKGNVLEEPSLYYSWNTEEPDEWIFTCHDEIKLCIEYNKAKEKVLFKGFKFSNKKCVGNEDIDVYFDLDSINIYNGKSHFEASTIEDLINSHLILTENATKFFL